jgi:hypothetical protein
MQFERQVINPERVELQSWRANATRCSSCGGERAMKSRVEDGKRQHLPNLLKVAMPMQSSIGRDRDPEHRHLRLPSGIAGIGPAIPRLRRLQNLFHLDLWLARV